METKVERWAGIDDGLQEKQPGSGAIYDEESGEFLFTVPPRYRPLIVRAVNSFEAMKEAATFARNRLLQDSGDQESIDQLNAALKLADDQNQKL